MNNLLDKGKEFFIKIRNQVIKIGIKKVSIGAFILVVGITGIVLLTGGSEEMVFANVVHPTSSYNNYYTFNEVKNFNKVKVSGTKIKLKENKVNNNETRKGDVEFEFTIKNTSKETIDNIGYMIFLKDLDGKPFAIRGAETFSLKAGESKKIKVDHIKSNENIKTNTNMLFVDNYDKDYATLNVYQQLSAISGGAITTSEL